MKRSFKIAGSVGTSFALAILFFFFVVDPVHAPSGGKLWTGGRTIATLQEQGDFDKRLLRLQICYGVKLTADSCTLERRRVCKVMLVHEIESQVEQAGKFLKSPVEFRCEDTALARPGLDDDAVSLRPNAENAAIKTALDPLLRSVSPQNPAVDARARAACEFLTDCKWAMRPSSFSLRKLASCATTANATHRSLAARE